VLRDSAGSVHGLEERVRARGHGSGTACRPSTGDAVLADVRKAGHPDHCGQFAASQRARGTRAWHSSGSAEAGIADYDDANRYLGEHYIAEHNRRYARPAAEAADYHRRRPTARQLDQVFWLEEERVVSEDWVVRYKNRLL
jgi:hypothetical protein